jgi:cell division protein FtsL
MKDYHRQRIQNRVAVDATSRVGLGETCRYLLVAATLAALVITYPWVHSEMITLGYQIQELKRDNATLREQRQALILEQAASKSPQRIDQYARGELGLIPASSEQVIFLRDSGALPAAEILAESVASPSTLSKETRQ